MKTFVKRGMVVFGALAALVVFGPGTARAQAAAAPPGVSGSGGPGTLGTEAPTDSAVAQGYIHSRTPVKGDATLALEEKVRQFQIQNRRAMTLAQQVATANNPELAQAAQQVADARSIADFNILKGAQDTGFVVGGHDEEGFASTGSMGSSADLPGPAQGERATTSASAEESTGTGSSSAGVSRLPPDVREAAATAGELAKEARKQHRLQLASSLDEAHRALDRAASAVMGSAEGS